MELETKQQIVRMVSQYWPVSINLDSYRGYLEHFRTNLFSSSQSDHFWSDDNMAWHKSMFLFEPTLYDRYVLSLPTYMFVYLRLDANGKWSSPAVREWKLNRAPQEPGYYAMVILGRKFSQHGQIVGPFDLQAMAYMKCDGG